MPKKLGGLEKNYFKQEKRYGDAMNTTNEKLLNEFGDVYNKYQPVLIQYKEHEDKILTVLIGILKIINEYIPKNKIMYEKYREMYKEYITAYRDLEFEQNCSILSSKCLTYDEKRKLLILEFSVFDFSPYDIEFDPHPQTSNYKLSFPFEWLLADDIKSTVISHVRTELKSSDYSKQKNKVERKIANLKSKIDILNQELKSTTKEYDSIP